MATFDVNLPKDKPVVFPARCVVCEKPNPDGFAKLSVLGSTSYSMVYSSNTLTKIEGVPTCKGCAPGLKRYHWWLKSGTYIGGVIAGLMLFVPVLLILKIVVAALCLAVAPILTVLFPPPFGATFMNDRANYEFKSKLVGDEFAALNADEG